MNDGSTTNATRLGAVRDISLVIEKIHEVDANNPKSHSTDGPNSIPPSNSSSGLLIIGGDTLFYPDFSLPDFLSQFSTSPDRNLILYYDVTDTRKNGIIELDESTGLVTNFLEKPLPTETSSRKACPCFYLLNQTALERVKTYVDRSTKLEEVDAPGNLIRHFVQINRTLASDSRAQPSSPSSSSPSLLSIPILAIKISGRFDIGGLDSYIECNEWFRKREKEGESFSSHHL